MLICERKYPEIIHLGDLCPEGTYVPTPTSLDDCRRDTCLLLPLPRGRTPDIQILAGSPVGGISNLKKIDELGRTNKRRRGRRGFLCE